MDKNTPPQHLEIVVTRPFIVVKHDTDEQGKIIGISDRRTTEVGEKFKVAYLFGREQIAAKKALQAGTPEADQFLSDLKAGKAAAAKAAQDAVKKADDMNALVQEEVARQLAVILAAGKASAVPAAAGDKH